MGILFADGSASLELALEAKQQQQPEGEKDLLI